MKNEIYLGDCIQGMSSLPDKSVNTCITSPPYYGLRDYGCDGQIGLEETPESYVQKMVDVFREVKRVLRDDGTLWLNLGDSYAGSGGAGNQFGQLNNGLSKYKQSSMPSAIGLKPKDLIGIPWRVAFALQADGWYLRQDIIWHKPNPMPESVRDRCTKAHEYIFLLSKSERYYYDHEAIKENSIHFGNDKRSGMGNIRYEGKRSIDKTGGSGQHSFVTINESRNRRSVWSVTTKPFKGAHFATYPENLIVPCVLAGCVEGGLVLDPFMGAGTTALVSKKLGRNYVGFELNPEYRKIALNRIESVCGPLKY
jgi:DNA modification methylase